LVEGTTVHLFVVKLEGIKLSTFIAADWVNHCSSWKHAQATRVYLKRLIYMKLNQQLLIFRQQ